MKNKLAPILVAWVLFDTTTDEKYIKMNPADGSLAIFDTEEAAMAAKRLTWGTDYERCEYYSAPAEPVIRKLGIMGAAFDPPSTRRAYTYSYQPDNPTAWKLGRITCKERSGGDFIDYGLQLLQHLQDEGFGVFEIDESDPTPQPSTKYPGADCTDQGCPAHYATPDVAKLVEALESLMEYVPYDVVQCRGDKCRELWCASCFGEEDAETHITTAAKHLKNAKSALAAHRQQGGEL